MYALPCKTTEKHGLHRRAPQILTLLIPMLRLTWCRSLARLMTVRPTLLRIQSFGALRAPSAWLLHARRILVLVPTARRPELCLCLVRRGTFGPNATLRPRCSTQPRAQTVA